MTWCSSASMITSASRGYVQSTVRRQPRNRAALRTSAEGTNTGIPGHENAVGRPQRGRGPRSREYGMEPTSLSNCARASMTEGPRGRHDVNGIAASLTSRAVLASTRRLSTRRDKGKRYPSARSTTIGISTSGAGSQAGPVHCVHHSATVGISGHVRSTEAARRLTNDRTRLGRHQLR